MAEVHIPHLDEEENEPTSAAGGLAGYFGDTALHEQLLLERYEKLLARLDQAIGDE